MYCAVINRPICRMPERAGLRLRRSRMRRSGVSLFPFGVTRHWRGRVNVTAAGSRQGVAAHGLLQSLVVRKDKRGKYAVVAGRRRLLALESLAENGDLPATAPIACNILENEANAVEIGLAENVQREAMHPADEFEAFRDLVDDGLPLADIAARFGVTEPVVQKRLKLARVSPKLLDAFRRGEMTLQHVMAFTVSDDHAAQERVWSSLPKWQKGDPSIIRDCLSEHEITASDRRVRFVTLKAYEKAGGAISRDLFNDGEDGVFILDEVLLESLVAKKLGRVAGTIRKEGWKWVEIRGSFDHDEWSECERFHPEPSPLPPDTQGDYDAQFAERESVWDLAEPDEAQVANRLPQHVEATGELRPVHVLASLLFNVNRLAFRRLQSVNLQLWGLVGCGGSRIADDHQRILSHTSAYDSVIVMMSFDRIAIVRRQVKKRRLEDVRNGADRQARNRFSESLVRVADYSLRWIFAAKCAHSSPCPLICSQSRSNDLLKPIEIR